MPAVGAGAEHVTCGDDPIDGCHATLALAVAASADGDTVLLSPGTYPESLSLVDRELQLRGEGPTPLISGDGTSAPVFWIRGGNIRMEGLVVANGTGRAFEIERGAKVELDRVAVTGGPLVDRGGLILASDSQLDVMNSTFSGGRASKEGGQIYASNSLTRLSTMRMEGGFSAFGGSVSLTYDDDTPELHVEIDDTTFSDNRGGTIVIGGPSQSSVPVSLTIRKSRFERNVTPGGGVVHAHYLGGTVLFEENVFAGNTGTSSNSAGAVFHDVGSATVRRSMFCDMRSQLGSNGAALQVYNTPTLDVRNSQFVDNHQTALALTTNVGFATVYNNHFVGNKAGFEPVLAAGASVDLRFSDNLVAYNVGTSTRAAIIRMEAPAVVDYNLWWANDPPHPEASDQTAIRNDPRLDGYVAGATCDYLNETQPFQADPLWPSWYGAARDAGSGRDVDVDRSALDIGAFGGSEARPAPDWVDDDRDGVPVLFDCDRTDPTIGG
ncbi:MAG: hypothetical protein ACI9MC_003216, partial [Kiritimatiellia bacterium]